MAKDLKIWYNLIRQYREGRGSAVWRIGILASEDRNRTVLGFYEAANLFERSVLLNVELFVLGDLAFQGRGRTRKISGHIENPGHESETNAEYDLFLHTAMIHQFA